MPTTGIGLDQVVKELTHLMQGHPYHTRNFVTNVLPMASIPGVLGQFTNALLNGNNLWDVYGPLFAECEVKVVAMMSKLVGYDYTKSFGYTTWVDKVLFLVDFVLPLQNNSSSKRRWCSY